MFTHYEDMKGDVSAKIGVVWGVRDHPWSSEKSPFDRAHMTFYSTLIETMHLSCTVFELLCGFSSKVGHHLYKIAGLTPAFLLSYVI